jgi:hypothetical protein
MRGAGLQFKQPWICTRQFHSTIESYETGEFLAGSRFILRVVMGAGCALSGSSHDLTRYAHARNLFHAVGAIRLLMWTGARLREIL